METLILHTDFVLTGIILLTRHPYQFELDKNCSTMISRTEPQYEIREHFHSEQTKIKIIHVGAGASGLLTAYKARKFLKNYELICYEK